MDWPTQLVAPPVRFTDLAAPTPDAPMQVLWYTAAREPDRFTVRNWQGELLAEDPSWTALCERLGWTRPAAAVQPQPLSRPPVGRTAVRTVVVDRRDRDYGHPITYYLYDQCGVLLCMSHSWSWLCHIRGWATLPGLEPGQRIPAGFPNAYDTHDEGADRAAIAAWDPTRPSSAKAGDEQASHLRARGRSDGENGAASRDARPLAKEGSSSSLETRRDESGPSRSPPTSSPAEADPQIGLF